MKNASRRDSGAFTLAYMNEAHRTFGGRMRAAMEDADISAAALARAVDTSETTIGNWRDDRVKPTEAKAALALRISKRLGVRIEWLIEHDGPMRAPAALSASPAASEIDSLRLVQAALASALVATIPAAGVALARELAAHSEAPEYQEWSSVIAGIARRAPASPESTVPPRQSPAGRESAGHTRRQR